MGKANAFGSVGVCDEACRHNGMLFVVICTGVYLSYQNVDSTLITIKYKKRTCTVAQKTAPMFAHLSMIALV